MVGEAPSSEQAKRPGDLICEPDAEALAEWHRLYETDSGKFIRIGDIVLIGPGFADPVSGARLKHDDIFMGAFWDTDEELQAKVREASKSANKEQALDPEGYLIDAGHYDFQVNEAGEVIGFQVSSDSHDYGRADETGRQKTGDLVREQLGDIPVRVADY